MLNWSIRRDVASRLLDRNGTPRCPRPRASSCQSSLIVNRGRSSDGRIACYIGKSGISLRFVSRTATSANSSSDTPAKRRCSIYSDAKFTGKKSPLRHSDERCQRISRRSAPRPGSKTRKPEVAPGQHGEGHSSPGGRRHGSGSRRRDGDADGLWHPGRLRHQRTRRIEAVRGLMSV